MKLFHLTFIGWLCFVSSHHENYPCCLPQLVCQSISVKKNSQVNRRKSACNVLLIKSLFSLEKLFLQWTFSGQNKIVALPATAYSCMFAHLLLTCHFPGAEEMRRKLFSSGATSWRRLRSSCGFPQLCWMLVQLPAHGRGQSRLCSWSHKRKPSLGWRVFCGLFSIKWCGPLNVLLVNKKGKMLLRL